MHKIDSLATLLKYDDLMMVGLAKLFQLLSQNMKEVVVLEQSWNERVKMGKVGDYTN